MKAWNKAAGLLALSIGLTSLSPVAGASAPIGSGALSLTKIGGYNTAAGFDEGGAEIVTYDPSSRNVYLINGATKSIEIVSLADLQAGVPNQPLTVPDERKISIAAHSPEPGLFGDVTSVVLHPTEDLLAAAVPNEEKTESGSVVFFTKAGEYLGYVRVGSLPDMITATPDGKAFLVANEGEPNGDYSVDPEGSVSIVTFATVNGAYDFAAETVRFADPSIVIGEGVRYASLLTGHVEAPTHEQWAKDFEPEYISVAEDGKTAYVGLQENNAIAVLDLERKKFTHVHSLGFKNYMLPENALDPSDRDPEDDPQINIASGYPVLGTYMPDGMALKTIGGKTYLFTANEGDGRAYGPDEEITDEVRFKDVVGKNGPEENVSIALDAAYYPGTTQAELDAIDLVELRGDERLGRLKLMNYVSNAAYTDADTGVTSYKALYTFGGRSFSIWDVSRLGTEQALTFDSGSQFERIVASLLPELFNSAHDENEKDSRSDDKGPEPEYVELGDVNGKTYAFVGLERQSAVMVYDVTTPSAPTFVSFVNMRDVNESGKGDLGPEGLDFVPAADSPTGKPLLLTGNEVSGTLAVFEMSAAASPITRGELASMLVGTLGLDASAGTAFADVAAGDAHAGAIGAAYEAGVVSGYEDGTFRPNRPVSRQELAVAIRNALTVAADGEPVKADVEGALKGYADRSAIAAWAVEAVAVATEQGLLRSTTSGEFAPTSDAAWSEAAAAMEGLLSK
ncbi:S-layer homology domain-containing protein [Paenibacillus sp. TRM 82003]|nr:S-layer homology domain-containing protein [Paenibacillus sp. TRM 82003]